MAAAPPAVSPAPGERSGVLQSLVELDLGRFVIPPSVSQPAPTAPPIPEPSPTAIEFEDLIIDTYHAIEPWVRYGFELVTWGVGWVPWVGWLAPQIMIFYDFGERIVESLVVNSANWLWGPLPFGEGLVNVGQDSWDALVQFGIDQWNFWLWPLPPLPFEAQQSQADEETAVTATGGSAAAGDEVAPVTASRPQQAEAVRPMREHQGSGWRRGASQEASVEEVPVPGGESAVPAEESAVPGRGSAGEGVSATAKQELATEVESAPAEERSVITEDEKEPVARTSPDSSPRDETTETSGSRSHDRNDEGPAGRDHSSPSRHGRSPAE